MKINESHIREVMHQCRTKVIVRRLLHHDTIGKALNVKTGRRENEKQH